MDKTDLERALAASGLDAPVRFDEVTESTNATALALADRGYPEWTLVGAAHQTAGRGRLGRTWEDEPGGSLLFSLVLRPAMEPGSVGLISLLAGASMSEAIRERTGLSVTCRWPNDLMIDDQKLGGILAESRFSGGSLRFVVVGIGVNLGAPPIPGAAALGWKVDGPILLRSFVGVFAKRYMPGHPAFAQAVIRAWRPLAATLGRQVEAVVADGARMSGRAVDVDGYGGLIVETADGMRTVSFGEIRHLVG
jgi:BirA family biotin operon repressor/biotin-[acetyl-CoA-carboxylase] ligase